MEDAKIIELFWARDENAIVQTDEMALCIPDTARELLEIEESVQKR